MKYKYVKDYKNDNKLRESFNKLTDKTFLFNFDNWYSNDFWSEKYNPHSIVDGEKVVANMSVNLMKFDMDGAEKHYIQIGTVMTDEDYRGQGLARYIIENIIDEYKDRVDGIYLFGNDSVIDFYPKFGFVKSAEYQYSKKINAIDNIKKVKHIDVSNKANWKDFLSAVENSISNDRFTMDNLELLAFWTMEGDLIYYLAEEDAYIIAEVKEEELFIYQIVADHKVNLEKVISSFGNEIKKVTLGFTPYDESGYTVEELHKEDCTLFILGKDLKNIESKKLMFPTLSHA